MNEKWRTVLSLSLAECLAMGLWLSASAVTPALSRAWHLSSGDAAWLTMSVQIGFVVGAFLSALFNVADIFPARVILAIGTAAGAVATAIIAAFVESIVPALVLRFITGVSLALVYPVGMKIMATWMKKDRGLGLGLLVGALTLGTALPHLLKTFGSVENWQLVLYIASALALVGAALGLRFGRLGPYQAPTPKFRWRYIGETLRHRGVRLANFGYLGHMWELYAMWTWLPIFLLESFKSSNAANGGSTVQAAQTAALVAFLAIAAGGVGSLLAGYVADRWGRSRTTIASMVLSGLCASGIGFFFFNSPFVVGSIAVIWGFAVVADSAQFSSCVSELCHREYMGTALTMQTSLGFLLTMASIRLLPVIVNWIGWRWAFTTLAIGPLFGIWAMWLLLRSDHAGKLAGGRG